MCICAAVSDLPNNIIASSYETHRLNGFCGEIESLNASKHSTLRPSSSILSPIKRIRAFRPRFLKSLIDPKPISPMSQLVS